MKPLRAAFPQAQPARNVHVKRGLGGSIPTPSRHSIPWSSHLPAATAIFLDLCLDSDGTLVCSATFMSTLADADRAFLLLLITVCLGTSLAWAFWGNGAVPRASEALTGPVDETIFRNRRSWPETKMRFNDIHQQRGSIMWDFIISLIYHHSCKRHLAGMRRHRSHTALAA